MQQNTQNYCWLTRTWRWKGLRLATDSWSWCKYSYYYKVWWLNKTESFKERNSLVTIFTWLVRSWPQKASKYLCRRLLLLFDQKEKVKLVTCINSQWESALHWRVDGQPIRSRSLSGFCMTLLLYLKYHVSLFYFVPKWKDVFYLVR
mgnify:CR=1 FL=1